MGEGGAGGGTRRLIHPEPAPLSDVLPAFDLSADTLAPICSMTRPFPAASRPIAIGHSHRYSAAERALTPQRSTT